MRSRIWRVCPCTSWLVSAAVRPARNTRSPCTTARVMRGPGGWVMSMRRISAMVFPSRTANRHGSVARRRREGKLSRGRRVVLVVDDALRVCVDAVGDEGLVADDAETMHLAGRDRDRHPWHHRDRALFAPIWPNQPGFAPPFEHGQHLD